MNTRLLNGLSTYGAVALLAFALAASHHLDVDDHSDEWATSASLADAQRQASAAHARELREAERCRLRHGESALVWTADDQPVCVPRRGKPVQHAEVQR